MTGEATFEAHRTGLHGSSLATGAPHWAGLDARDQTAWEAAAAAGGAEGQEELVVALEAFDDGQTPTATTARLVAAGWIPPAA